MTHLNSYGIFPVTRTNPLWMRSPVSMHLLYNLLHRHSIESIEHELSYDLKHELKEHQFLECGINLNATEFRVLSGIIHLINLPGKGKRTATTLTTKGGVTCETSSFEVSQAEFTRLCGRTKSNGSHSQRIIHSLERLSETSFVISYPRLSDSGQKSNVLYTDRLLSLQRKVNGALIVEPSLIFFDQLDSYYANLSLVHLERVRAVIRGTRPPDCINYLIVYLTYSCETTRRQMNGNWQGGINTVGFEKLSALLNLDSHFDRRQRSRAKTQLLKCCELLKQAGLLQSYSIMPGREDEKLIFKVDPSFLVSGPINTSSTSAFVPNQAQSDTP